MQMSSLRHSSHSPIYCRSVCTLGTHPMHPTATVRDMPHKGHSPVVCLSHHAEVRSQGFQGDAKSGRLLVPNGHWAVAATSSLALEASRPLDGHSGGASICRPWPCSGLGSSGFSGDVKHGKTVCQVPGAAMAHLHNCLPHKFFSRCLATLCIHIV